MFTSKNELSKTLFGKYDGFCTIKRMYESHHSTMFVQVKFSKDNKNAVSDISILDNKIKVCSDDNMYLFDIYIQSVMRRSSIYMSGFLPKILNKSTAMSKKLLEIKEILEKEPIFAEYKIFNTGSSDTQTITLYI